MKDDDGTTTDFAPSPPSEVVEWRSRLRRGNALIAVEDSGVWTAEAREPHRRELLLQQYRLARRLRSQLERAATRAQQVGSVTEARQILIQQTPHISCLASLTQAVRGGYTLNDYNGYTQWLERQSKQRQDEEDAARTLIEGQVKAMQEEKQKRGTKRGWSPTRRGTRRTTGSASRSSKRSKSKTRTSDAHIMYDSTAASAKTAPPSTARAAASSRQRRLSPEKRPHHGQRPHHVLLGDSSVQMDHSMRSTRRTVVSRQCHDCKSTTTDFRKCHFWFENGQRCKKTYCIKCLQAKYGEPTIPAGGPDQARMMHGSSSDKDWHCPSCVGTCRCELCRTKREKERRLLARGQGQRRSSNRYKASL